MSPGHRVVVADDTAVVRRGVASMLAQAGHEVIGEAADLQSTLEEVRRARPELLVVDIRMPPSHTLEGLQIARTVRRTYGHTAVLVLSQHIVTAYARRLFEDSPSAVGYMLKDSVQDASQLDEAVQRLCAGGTVLDPRLVEHLLTRPRGETSPLEVLSAAELATLELLVEGLSNHGIAERRTIAQSTVDSHVSAIFQKLGLDHHPDTNRRVRAVLAYLSSTG